MKFVILLFFIIVSLFAKEDVSLLLHWKHQFQFAGYYMAKEKGFYDDLGLDVNIIEYGHGIKPFEEVIEQHVNYGVGRSSLIIHKAEGADVKMLFATFQSSPHIFLASIDSNITTLKDFAFKKIMVTPDVSNTVSLRAIANKVGIKIEDMELQPHSFNVEDLGNAKTDLMSAYISNEPYLLKEKGIEAKIFNPSDYGFDFYSDILFTSANEMQEHPKRTIDFKNASLKGWKYAFDNMEETVLLILKKYNTQGKSRGALAFEAKALKKLAYYKTDTLGKIDKAKIQRMYDMYNVMGFVNAKVDIDDLVYTEETNTFTSLEKIDETSKQKIISDWGSINPQRETDYSLIIKILFISFLVLVFLLYRHYVLKKANKKLEHLASTDSMTKLYNRRYFSETTEHILALARRDSTKMSVLLLDIDKFKDVNDTYGHKVGDDVIIALSKLLKKMTRESDIVCRYGGEEFAVSLPKTNVDDAYMIAKKIRKKAEVLHIDLGNSKTLNFTVSIGVSEVDILKEKSIEMAMNRADKALYEAKEMGRNRVIKDTEVVLPQ